MMRRLREIPCRMLARTAVQPRVLVALIQCATMATEVVEVATESEEDVIINCVAIFYEEGKEEENFRKKNNIGLVGQCREMLDENTRDIQKLTGIHTTLNGPQGHVSARTVASVAMIDTGLQRLHANLKQFKYDHTNLLSCVTLDVENCHATVHVKRANLPQAEYCKSFGTTMKETVKRVANWAAYYHTSRRSWYPTPESALLLSQAPVMKTLPIVNMCQADCDSLRDWAPPMELP